MPFDIDKWDYDQFNNPNKFQWIIGTTPFSNWQFVVGSWGVYFSTIIGLKRQRRITTLEEHEILDLPLKCM
ncbi:14480_t:CDS:2, partial [Entrophospora sp. SA101]